MFYKKNRGKNDTPSLSFLISDTLITLVTYRHPDGKHLQTTLQAVTYAKDSGWGKEEVTNDLLAAEWQPVPLPETLPILIKHLEGITGMEGLSQKIANIFHQDAQD
ncbi:MAG: hypothetical protein SF052_15800 [Bacteroidia bacterium]|nr:hypothetical protein [Bacteroidia bacterium]